MLTGTKNIAQQFQVTHLDVPTRIRQKPNGCAADIVTVIGFAEFTLKHFLCRQHISSNIIHLYLFAFTLSLREALRRCVCDQSLSAQRRKELLMRGGA